MNLLLSIFVACAIKTEGVNLSLRFLYYMALGVYVRGVYLLPYI